MAKSRVTINPMYTGGAGGYSFYVRDGEQVVRQRKNNSNYGSTASRSYAQMIRRIRWGNLVNVFKAIKSWQQKAYDSKNYGQTDYNIFMQLNINKVSVGTTKEMNEGGAGIVEAYQVSRGSIPPIGYTVNTTTHLWITDIVLQEAINVETTIGDLSTDILANNPTFQEGDNIAIIFMKNWMDSRVEWPYVQSQYNEITLNKANTALVADIPVIGERLSKSTSDTLQLSYTEPGPYLVGSEVGFVCIHTRKAGGSLQVSSQSILMNTQTIISEFSGTDWDNTCINTYGLDTEVPLDPNFKPGSIARVTANGAVVSNAETLNGSQELRIYYGDVDASQVKLYFNDVLYTPLFTGDGYLGYILGDNGLCKIFVDDKIYMSLNVSGIIVPENLTTYKQMGLVDTIDGGKYDRVDTMVTNALCINYDRLSTSSYPYFGLSSRFSEEPSLQDIECFNCSLEYSKWFSGSLIELLNFSIVEPTEPAYVKYQGFIFAVFNYTN